MDLASYADLVVELVNTGRPADPEQDSLRDLEALRELLTIRPHLGGRVTRQDLDAMRELRAELRKIFDSVADGDEDDAIERLNSLLIQHPIHPQISGHDGQRWHLHLTESGSVPDRYAAGAAMGLAVYISDHGIGRLRICQVPSCGNVFFDNSANRSRQYCAVHCSDRGGETAGQGTYRDRGDGRAAGDSDTREGGQ
ncbi:MAG TPA: CGNR zinc finger domain-containing protein [Streptosporangiaceae bacterium]|nr:CGNR zinc finger domain-containing protein [Streptosporangiaceae bacterium]